MSDLYELLSKIQDAEEMAFYMMTREPDKFKRGRRKVIDDKLKDAIQELAAIISKENAE